MLKKKNKNPVTKSDMVVKIPITKISVMSTFLIIFVLLFGYAGYLGIVSVWKFTHPQFNVSFESFKALPYIAKGAIPPAFPTPNFVGANAPDDFSKENFMKGLADFKTNFRTKFPTSKLLNVSDNDLLNLGWSFCQAKQKSIDETGNFSAKKIGRAHV